MLWKLSESFAGDIMRLAMHIIDIFEYKRKFNVDIWKQDTETHEAREVEVKK